MSWVLATFRCVAGIAGLGALTTMALACADGGEQLPPVQQERAIYVSTSGNDTASGDAPTTPVATIAVGIERALGCTPEPCEVRVAQGSYQEQLVLADGVNIRGGWSSDFSAQDLAQHEVVISSDMSPTLQADQLTQPTLVEGLTLVGADMLEGEPGASTIVAQVHDSKGALTLRDCVLDAGAAAAGADGADGEPIVCNAVGGQGGVAFDCGGSVGANGTADSDRISGGEGGTPGNSNCPNACPLVGSDGISGGSNGVAGGDGLGGLAGAIASDVLGTFVDGVWMAAQGEPGQRGQHGTGGGGGGSGGSKRFVACFGCNTLLGGRGGDGAPGGCGGGGGEAGQAGGASFGLVLIGSEVALENVEINAGPGGSGGAGGDGLAGEPGGTDGSMGVAGSNSQQCGLINYSSGGGGLGGPGGAGGDGGGGAGGAGGPSVALALVAASSYEDVGGNLFNFGPGGMGGLGGLGAADASGGMAGVDMAIVEYQ